jgi:cell division septum initiation protein DivIVA
MADQPTFRTALNGYNKKDVNDYIDFLNNKHTTQLNQVQTEMDDLRTELMLARQAPARSIRLEAELAAANMRCVELENALNAMSAELEQLKTQAVATPDPAPVIDPIVEPVIDEVIVSEVEEESAPAPICEVVPAPAPVSCENRISEELAAYRRAERAERRANQRAKEIYMQANGVLADATARVDDTATQFAELADQIAAQLAQFREMMIDSKSSLRDAATAMYAIRPNDEDDE